MRLTEEISDPSAVRRLLKLFLKPFDGVGRLTALEIQLRQSFLSLNRGWVAAECLVEKSVCLRPAFLLGTQEPELNVSDGALRRELDQTIQIGFRTSYITLIDASRRMKDVTFRCVRSDLN